MLFILSASYLAATGWGGAVQIYTLENSTLAVFPLTFH